MSVVSALASGGRQCPTHGQGHDPQLLPQQLHHQALLQRRGPAAQHRPAPAAQLQEVAPQLPLQGKVQSAALHHQDAVRAGGLRSAPFSRTPALQGPQELRQ